MRSPIDPLQRLGQWISKIDRRLKVLETAPRLQNASVSKGSTRFIGLESLIVIGSQLVSGLLHVVGRVTISGLGILEVLGLIDLTGRMVVSADGEIVIGNVTIKDGKITVGAGGAQIVIDGGTGKITAGDLVIDPSVGGGSVAFPGGAMVQADPGGGVRVIQGSNRVYVGSGLVSMQMGTRAISISASGHQMTGMDTIPRSFANGAPAGCIWSDGSGEILRVVPD